jgi:hypothetical protein
MQIVVKDPLDVEMKYRGAGVDTRCHGAEWSVSWAFGKWYAGYCNNFSDKEAAIAAAKFEIDAAIAVMRAEPRTSRRARFFLDFPDAAIDAEETD